jgi:hypothetical protein
VANAYSLHGIQTLNRRDKKSKQKITEARFTISLR